MRLFDIIVSSVVLWEGYILEQITSESKESDLSGDLNQSVNICGLYLLAVNFG